IGTPVLLSDLPAGNASGRVASCLPLGKDGQNYLIGVSLYNHGNVWGVANPPEDWNCADAAGAASQGRQQWPYNVFSGNVKSHSKK
ncbi:MAG TPA: hypothetical protein VND65_20155, partial [Candidatus Binatia bacterium]|nr:hypothetical protein [Candidatus Binatia bacterium]